MESNQTTDWMKVAEVELIYKSEVRPSDRPRIIDSREAYELLINCWDLNKIELQEEFKVLLLNQSNRVLGLFPLSSGGITGTVADPRLIFAAAIKACAVSIILSHSHPSGNLKPSRNDEELTTKIRLAGQLFDIRVADHLIVSRTGYFSFADEGLM